MTRRGAASLVLGLALARPGLRGADRGQGLGRGAVRRARRARPGPTAGRSCRSRRAGPASSSRRPHGTSDTATDLMGRELAKLTGFGLVVATGYANVDATGRRYNVNRPDRERARRGRAPGGGDRGRRARSTRPIGRQVAEAAQGPLRLYVEVHGNGRQESAGRVEIATVGLSRDDAWRLKTLLELIRDARLPAEGDVPRLDVWVEPVRTRSGYTASAAKQSGILGADEAGAPHRAAARGPDHLPGGLHARCSPTSSSSRRPCCCRRRADRRAARLHRRRDARARRARDPRARHPRAAGSWTHAGSRRGRADRPVARADPRQAGRRRVRQGQQRRRRLRGRAPAPGPRRGGARAPGRPARRGGGRRRGRRSAGWRGRVEEIDARPDPGALARALERRRRRSWTRCSAPA